MTTNRKKVFITGGSGFIGQHLIRDFIAQDNFDLFVLSRDPSKIPLELHDKITIVKGDIFLISDQEAILSQMDYFIHIAGEKKSEVLMEKVNIEGMHLILQTITKYPSVKLLHIGTSGIYGIEHHPEKVITEESNVFPNNLYETSKYESEKMIAEFSDYHPLKYTILRPSNVFGESEPGQKLLNLFQSLKSGRFMYLERNARVNYVYVKYLTAIIVHCINKDLFSNQVYNVNSPATLFEFIEQSKRILGIKKKTLVLPSFLKIILKLLGNILDWMPEKFQLINSRKYRELTNKKVYAVDKIKQVVNLDERYFLNKGLQNLISNYQEQGWL